MDEFIVEKRLVWIPYNNFKNVEYLDKGGFGIVYKAIYEDIEVVLKCLNIKSSDKSIDEFLNEVR